MRTIDFNTSCGLIVAISGNGIPLASFKVISAATKGSVVFNFGWYFIFVVCSVVVSS
jgi:hypothetical protein